METQTQATTPPQALSEPVKPQCKYCKAQTLETFYFCPNCGKKIKEPPYKFSWGKTIAILLESVLLPPFGLIPGIKYILKDDHKAQMIGMITIGLTIISTIVGIIFTVNFINHTAKTYNNIYQTQDLLNNPSGSTQDQIEQLQNISQ